jgi:DNA-binding transcriptional MerR regulator
MGTLRMHDLIEATGVTDRMVRIYIQRGVLPHATGRGTGPVYTQDHLVRLRAVRRLLAERCSLDEIRRRLARISPEELARLGAPPPTAAPPAPPPAGEAASGMVPPGAERWDRMTLLPGLELHVRGDAGPLVRRLAEEIHARYSAAAAD